MTVVIEALEWNINREAGSLRGASEARRAGTLTSVFIQGGRMMNGPTSGRDVHTSATAFVYLSTLIFNVLHESRQVYVYVKLDIV